MCLDHYSRLSWWAEQHWSPHKCKKCKWGIVGETSDRKPIFSVLLWPYRDIPSLLMQQFPAFAYGVLQATTITLVTQESYYEWKKVDQTPSCWSNRVRTVMLFKTSSLILQRILFIRTVPTIIFQPVEFLLRHHLQKLSHFWLYWIQRKRHLAARSDRRVWCRADGTHAPRQVPASVPVCKPTCAQHPSQTTFLDLPHQKTGLSRLWFCVPTPQAIL